MTPLSYQWFWNGAVLSDGGAVSGSASPNLALNGVTDNNAGNYSVIVTNSYGSVTSVVATLTVLNCTAPPRVWCRGGRATGTRWTSSAATTGH
jgi:hypothetical protein